MAQFQFNDEQTAILDHLHYKDSQILAVNALAGTGKTTTLKGVAEYPLKNERLRYFVFNKRNADEAATEFPNNTTVSTAHSFAFRSPHPDGGGTMGEVYGGSQARLSGGSLYGPLRDQLRQSVDFADRIRQVRQELRCSEGRALMAVQSVLRQFCQSADPQIGSEHIAPDLLDYIHRSGTNGIPKALLGAASWSWDRMRDPFSQFPIDHGAYLKLCSLSPPRIPADTILFDEAQDASPPMLEILKAQLQYGTKLVLVGDTYQHVYSFTGAVDAMRVMQQDHADLTKTLPLATSYRFGQEIADAGNHFLRLMGSPYLLTGKGPNGQVNDDSVNEVHAVLFRGNSGLLQAAVQAVMSGQKIHVVGGTGEIVNLVEAMGRLYKGEFAKHPELSFFDDWRQLSDYSQNPLGQGFAPLVKIVEQKQGRVETIAKALRATETDPKKAQYVLSTGHKSKGGQWDNVLLMDDFQRSWMANDPEGERAYQVPGEDALCLEYVACTRAQKVLYTNGLLDTMERALLEERQQPDSEVQHIPEVLAGLKAARNPEPRESLAEREPVNSIIIGLSGAPGAGKDTVADMLDMKKLSFSDRIYQEVAQAYGVSVDYLQDRINKDNPMALNGMAVIPEMADALSAAHFTPAATPRMALQAWGDYRRSQDPDYFIQSVREQAHGKSVVISDVRTPAEVDLVEELGGIMVRVRNDAAEKVPHPLETALSGYQMHYEIQNNGTLDDLREKVAAFKKEIQGAAPAPEVRPEIQETLYALARSPDDVKARKFVEGPYPDLQEILTFGKPENFLVKITKDHDPVILGHLTEQTRGSLRRTLHGGMDDLGAIPPNRDDVPAPIFPYARRP